MHIQRLCGAFLVAATLLSCAKPAAAPEFSAERFRAHVAFLADDLLEGRETGSRGYDIAARYIASQFDVLGVKPGGENGGWYQTVPFIESSLTGAAPTVTITGPGGTQVLRHREQVVVFSSVRGTAVNLSAPVVYVGFGAFDPAHGVDDYAGLDVRGKIVIAFRGVAPGLDSEIAAHLGRWASSPCQRRPR